MISKLSMTKMALSQREIGLIGNDLNGMQETCFNEDIQQILGIYLHHRRLLSMEISTYVLLLEDQFKTMWDVSLKKMMVEPCLNFLNTPSWACETLCSIGIHVN